MWPPSQVAALAAAMCRTSDRAWLETMKTQTVNNTRVLHFIPSKRARATDLAITSGRQAGSKSR